MAPSTTAGRSGRKGGERKSNSARAGRFKYIFLAIYLCFQKVYSFRYHAFIVILKSQHQKLV
jgi:hypothetical protein